MTTTLSQGQAELPRLVEIAGQGEDVIITLGGNPKARLTRADAADSTGGKAPVDMDAWLEDLEEARQKYATGNAGLSSEQILNEDRGTLIDRLIAQPLLVKHFEPLSRAEIYGAE